jgi:cell division initiation protein
VGELEAQVRGLKLERVRFLQDMDSLLARSKRFLQEEAPEMFPPPDVTRKMEEREASRLDLLGSGSNGGPGAVRPSQGTVRKIKD